MTPLQLQVAEVQALNPLVRRLRLQAGGGGTLPGCTAGALLQVLLPKNDFPQQPGNGPVLLREGEIDHRDHVLSAHEKAAGNVIQICVSRAKGSRLVLDL